MILPLKWIHHQTDYLTDKLTHDHTINFNESDTRSGSSNLKVLLWNARSLNKQINAFQSYMYSQSFDII